MPLGNAYYFDDAHGCERCIRGLPLARRARWVQLFAEFRAIAIGGKSLQFWELYDRRIADGSANKLHSPRFATLADQLLRLHNIEPEWVSADMAASLLISDGEDVGILEQIEWPRRDEDDKDGEPLDPDIDPSAQFLATLATHVGGLQNAIALAETEPQVELVEAMRASVAVQERVQAKQDRKAKPSDGKKPKPAKARTSAKVDASTTERMRAAYEANQLKIMSRSAQYQQGQDNG